MRSLLVVGLSLTILSQPTFAEIMPQGDANYKCQTTGGFFDFSPAGAIASCKQEIDEFCKTQNAPPILGKVTGEPSGFGVYARAEINFQCMSEEDRDARQRATADAQSQQLKIDVESSKKACQEDFGFTPSTPEFSNCLLEMQKEIFANRRAEKNRAALTDVSEAQVAQQRKVESERAATSAIQSIQQITTPRPPSRMNCTTYGSSTNCTAR